MTSFEPSTGSDVTTAEPHPARRRVKAAILLVGLVALGLTAQRASRDLSGQVVPPAWAFAAAAGLAAVGHVCAARAWASLFTTGERAELIGGYYTSQLTKYLPLGGAVQAAAQVDATRTTSLSMKQVGLRYAFFMAGNVWAGAIVSSLLIVAPAVSTIQRGLFGVLALTALAVLHPAIVSVVRAPVQRRFGTSLAGPSMSAVRRALLWSLGNMSAYAVAFSVLLGAVSPQHALRSAGAAAAAWTAGFLVLPLPAGLGVREAVLAALLSPTALGLVLMASIAHRLAFIAAEVALPIGHKSWRRAVHRRGRRREPS